MVQVVKEDLRKYCLTFNKQHWCRFLCWIAMGYRMSRQRSLKGYSPYFLLFGRWPIVEASVRDVLQKVVDLDSIDVPYEVIVFYFQTKVRVFYSIFERCVQKYVKVRKEACLRFTCIIDQICMRFIITRILKSSMSRERQ
jgi:hypothetical protein